MEKTDRYWRVGFRDGADFEETRTAGWANRIAGGISKGARVLRGQRTDGEWETVAVLIRRARGKTREKAVELAERIFDRLQEA